VAHQSPPQGSVAGDQALPPSPLRSTTLTFFQADEVGTRAITFRCTKFVPSKRIADQFVVPLSRARILVVRPVEIPDQHDCIVIERAPVRDHLVGRETAGCSKTGGPVSAGRVESDQIDSSSR